MEHLLILLYVQVGLALGIGTVVLNYNREPNTWHLVAGSIVIGILWPVSIAVIVVLYYKREK